MDTGSASMSKIDTYVMSHETQIAESEALREWELALQLGGASEKLCHSINIYNGVPVVPMPLQSKESRSLLSKLRDGVSERVFSLHRLMIIVYAPTVLRSTHGSISIKLFHQDTGEAIPVVENHEVAQATTFVCRWPRAVLARSKGLALLVAVDGVTTSRGSLVGVLTPYWEDKMSTKMVYEKTLPTLKYPLEEQEPSHYVKDMKKLRSIVADRVHLGGTGMDVCQQAITLAPPNASLEQRVVSPSLLALQNEVVLSDPGQFADVQHEFDSSIPGNQHQRRVMSNLPVYVQKRKT